MTRLADKVENALNETRMLILGAQVLFGFAFQSMFQPAFNRHPESLHVQEFLDVALMVVSLGLLIAPTTYHQIVELGNDSKRVSDFAGRMAALALLPFALGLGLNIFLATTTVLGNSLALPAGVAATLSAVVAWYGFEWLWRARDRHLDRGKEEREMNESTDLSNKIKQVLTELRVVLPGAQALLGFQLVAILTDSFDKLPVRSQYVHLASLGCIALSIVLLMAPAAFHRIVENGENTERMHRFSSLMLLAALIPLGLGIAGDLHMIVEKLFQDALLAGVVAVSSLVCLYALWFGLMLYIRWRTDRAAAGWTRSASREVRPTSAR